MKENSGKLRKVLLLFITFFKIGAFTFGGGYAMIPLIQREVTDNYKWLSEDDILDVVAISESTPGPIAINAATFIGYRVAGFFGAFMATFGVVIPSFVIIIIISFILKNFQNNKYVKYAFFGIRAGVLALIVKALYSMYKQCKKDLFAYIIMALSFVGVAVFNVNAVWIIIGCAVVGIVYSFILGRVSK